MRPLGWLLLLLAAVGWLATEVPLPETPVAADRPLGIWRRTPEGWQRATWLVAETAADRPALHPGVVGLFELLVCLTALLAFPTGPKTNATGDSGLRDDSDAPSAAPAEHALSSGERSPICPAAGKPLRAGSRGSSARRGVQASRSG